MTDEGILYDPDHHYVGPVSDFASHLDAGGVVVARMKMKVRGAPVVAMSGQSSAISNAHGSMSLVAGLMGLSRGEGAATGSFTTLAALQGIAQGFGSATGTLEAVKDFQGIALGVASAWGDLTLVVPLVGASQGQGSAHGDLEVVRSTELSGYVVGRGSSSAFLNLDAHLSGHAKGTSQATGALREPVDLEGAARASSSATGSLSIDVNLSGVASATSSAVGHLFGRVVRGRARARFSFRAQARGRFAVGFTVMEVTALDGEQEVDVVQLMSVDALSREILPERRSHWDYPIRAFRDGRMAYSAERWLRLEGLPPGEVSVWVEGFTGLGGWELRAGSTPTFDLPREEFPSSIATTALPSSSGVMTMDSGSFLVIQAVALGNHPDGFLEPGGVTLRIAGMGSKSIQVNAVRSARQRHLDPFIKPVHRIRAIR